jgi:stage II sporulation protein AA (anti-sigma F factor antagonist)
MSPTDWRTASAPQLHIVLSTSAPATTRATIVGEIDLATVPLLRERLMGAIHDKALDLLDIDLTGVKFLDCTGIGALVGVYNIAVQTGRRVQLKHPQPFVRRVLDLTGVLRIFTADLSERESSAGDHADLHSEPLRV